MDFLLVFKLTLIFSLFAIGETKHVVLDPELYNEFLDPELCVEQMQYVRNNSSLLFRFLDAGLKIPKGLLEGNFADFGNYYQCVKINEETPSSTIDGKFCMLRIPTEQSFQFPSLFPLQSNIDPSALEISDSLKQKVQQYEMLRYAADVTTGNRDEGDISNSFLGTSLQLGICVPKTCTTEEAIKELLFNVSAIGLRYEENFCRIKGDKPLTPGDYVAIAILSLFGLLTILSTSYDVYRTIYLNKDPKTANKVYQSFSAYTNSRNLITFSTKAGNLECLDGIRALAMIWVIVGHAVSNIRFFHLNAIEVIEWISSPTALWITVAPITVDTFFMIAGVLLVYTMVGKHRANTFLMSLPIFYLHRLLRMFPLLATAVLLQATLFNHFGDGPYWTTEAKLVNDCRMNWWSTLLHVQNYVHPRDMCITHSWYIALDIQLYFISPIVLYWVLTGNKTYAWTALTLGVIATVGGSAVYNFIMEFPGWNFALARLDDLYYFVDNYYFNTLTRAPVFFVGMTVGYLLHVHRGQKVKLSKTLVVLGWAIAAGILAMTLTFPYVTMQPDYDNRLLDNIMNTIIRPCWAVGLGWLVFACVHGYAGPINWFLTLGMWKFLARLSYAMYIFHYPIMYLISASDSNILYFSVGRLTFDFFSHFTVSMIVGFIAIVLIDAPCSIFFNMMIKSLQDMMAPPRKKSPTARDETTKETPISDPRLTQ